MRDEDWKGRSMVGDPMGIPAAMLSDISYQYKSKALGWHGIPKSRRLPEDQQERLREKMAQDKDLGKEDISLLRQAYWLDDLQLAVMNEIKNGGPDRDARAEMARKLWVALYARPYEPEGLAERLEAKGQKGAEIDGDGKAAGLSRSGIWRADDVHCMMLAEVWDPIDGFDSGKVWVATRGTENKARAMTSGAVTFFKDYVGDLYRNFAKSWRANYKDAYDALADGIEAMPEGKRPKEIWHVGHSFGGAMATESVMQGSDRMAALGVESRAYTFGSPGSGQMGLGTAAVAGAGLISFAAIGLAKWARDALGMGKPEGGMSKESSGLSLLARQGFDAAFGALSWITTTGPLWMLDTVSQTISNKIDAWRTGKKEFDQVGWAGFRTESAERRADEAGRMTHLAHRRDIVAAVRSSSGFWKAGEVAYAETAHAASLSPTADHAMSRYAKTAVDLAMQSGNETHPYLKSLRACERAVGKMMELQAAMHEKAKVGGREMEFLRGQLRSSIYRDEQEAPEWVREGIATVDREISRELRMKAITGRRPKAPAPEERMFFKPIGAHDDLPGFRKVVVSETKALGLAQKLIRECQGKAHPSTANDSSWAKECEAPEASAPKLGAREELEEMVAAKKERLSSLVAEVAAKVDPIEERLLGNLAKRRGLRLVAELAPEEPKAAGAKLG